MSSTSPDNEALLAEWKSSPTSVKQLAIGGTLLGVIVFLSFGASAFSGYVGWGRALASGVFQLFLLWFVSFSVQARYRWAWWALLVLVALRLWGGLGHTMRLVRLTLDGGLGGHGREVILDVFGVVAAVVGVVLVWLMFSKEVRDYVRKTVA